MVVGTACSNETDPTVLPPTLTLHEATGITRNEACLSGKIVLNGEGTVRDCYFVYGSSPEEMIQVADEKRAEQAYREIMRTNECSGWSRIIKTIYLKNRKRLAEGKRYTAKDDIYLRLAEDFLFRELAAALKVKKEDVESIISDRVKQLG